MFSIDSLNCTNNGGGRNNINGSSGNGKSCPLLRNAFGNGPLTRIAQQTSDILIGGGGSTNYLDGNAGNNLAIGDCASILFSDNYFLRNIVSTSPSVGESDVINMGDGNDMGIGGSGKDTIYGYNGTNILVGDSAMVLLYGS